MQVLVIEDDLRIATLVQQGMREEGYQVVVSGDGREGLELARSATYDLIILDLMLPRVDGFEVARQLRREGNRMPILMLTARDSEADTVQGLDLGADDYVTKPFSFSVFLARVRAILRRGPVSAPVIATVADLELQTGTHSASRGGKSLSLTPREFRLLELLVRCSPRVVPRQRIMEEIWGFDSEVTENNLEAFVSQLRAKVDGASERKLIRTVRGIGYCVREESEL